MMPIPTHLRGLVVPLDAKLDEEPLIATVQCPCGEQRFHLLYPGQKKILSDGREIPCVAKIGENYFLLIAARCVACYAENLLLDADFHGWNGFICHNAEQANLPRPSLTEWPCESCGNVTHTGVIRIDTEGQEDFVGEAEGEADDDRWPDGFSWFSMSVTCTDCNHAAENLISYETM